MSDLTIVASITGADGIDLMTSAYQIVGMGPGSKRRRRVTVDSEFVHGELVVASPLALTERMLTVRCKGSTADGLDTAMKNLDKALGQESYTVTGSFNGKAFTWADCTPADIEIGEGGYYEKFRLMRHRQEMTIAIPSSPVATAGPW